MRRLLPCRCVAVVCRFHDGGADRGPATLTADQIMAKVAANQDRTEAARTHYIYQQHIRMVSRKTGGKVMCEEVTDSRVSPQQKESQQQLLTLDGRYWQKGRYVHYTTLQEQEASEAKDSESKDEPKGKEVKDREGRPGRAGYRPGGEPAQEPGG